MRLIDITNIKKSIENRCKGITRLIFTDENVDALKIIIEKKDNGSINVDISSFGIRDNKDDPFYNQNFSFKLEKQKRNINPRSKLNLLQGKKKQQSIKVVNNIEKQESAADIANINKNNIIPNTTNNKIDIKLINTKIITPNKNIKNPKNTNKPYNIKKQKKSKIIIKNIKQRTNKKNNLTNTNVTNVTNVAVDVCNSCKLWKNKYKKMKGKYKKNKNKLKNKKLYKEKREAKNKKDCYQCCLDNGVYKYEDYTFDIYRVKDKEGNLVNISIKRSFDEDPEVEYYETDGENVVVVTNLWDGKKSKLSDK